MFEDGRSFAVRKPVISAMQRGWKPVINTCSQRFELALAVRVPARILSRISYPRPSLPSFRAPVAQWIEQRFSKSASACRFVRRLKRGFELVEFVVGECAEVCAAIGAVGFFEDR
jgi:hypothetical protein